jgi:hypothetical protein
MPSRRTPRPPLALWALVACAPILARAHDAAPVAYDVHAVRTPTGSDVAVETSYGLLRRGPDGRWRLLCDDVRGPGSKWFTVGPDGSVGMASAEGYARSPDGCGFTTGRDAAGPPLRLERISSPSGVSALLLLTEAAGGGTLLRSEDDGATFRSIELDGSDRPTSLAVDALTPGHAALLARRGEKLRIHESRDAGATWTAGALVEATHPTRLLSAGPSGLFLRTNLDGRGELSRLDGDVVTVVLSTAAPALFVTETRPGELWAASPRELWRSNDGGAAGTWTRQPEPGDLTCLRNVGGVLYACIEDDARRVVASASSDFGATWRELLRFSDVAGPVECADDTDVGRACNARWPVDATALGVALPAPEPPDAPADGCGCGAPAPALALVALAARRRRA